MKRSIRMFGITAGLAILAAHADAATILVAGPSEAIFANANETYCQVLNTGLTPVEVKIEARNEIGIATASKTVTIEPETGSYLSGGSQAVSCVFTGSKRIVGMLAGRDPATGLYTFAVPAR